MNSITSTPQRYAAFPATLAMGLPQRAVGRSKLQFAAQRRTHEQIANRLIQEARNDRPLLLSLDFDGTLFPYNTPYRDLNEKKIDALLELAELLHQKNGYPSLVLLTGRPLSHINTVTRGRLQGKPIIIVGEDGGHLYDCMTGGDKSLLKVPDKRDLEAFHAFFHKENKDPTLESVGQNRFTLHVERVNPEKRNETSQLLKTIFDKFKSIYTDTKLRFRDLYNILVVVPHYFNKQEGFYLATEHLSQAYAHTAWKIHSNFMVHIGDGRNDNPAFKYLKERYPDRSLTVFVGQDRPDVKATYHMVPENFDGAQESSLATEEGDVYRYELSRQYTKQVWEVLYKLTDALKEAPTHQDVKPKAKTLQETA